jgi:hypothetical protein
MNKATALVTATVAIALGVTAALVRNLHAERERADALAERLAELEPVEATRIAPQPRIEPQEPSRPVEWEIERRDSAIVKSESVAEPPSPAPLDRASAPTRRLIERLQAALVDGTPLQEYQVRALSDAFDRVHQGATADAAATE